MSLFNSGGNKQNKKENALYYFFCFVVFCLSPLLGLILFLIRFLPAIKSNSKQTTFTGTTATGTVNSHITVEGASRPGTADPYEAGQSTRRAASGEKDVPINRWNLDILCKVTSQRGGKRLQVVGGIFSVLFGCTFASKMLSNAWMITYGYILLYFGALLSPSFWTACSIGVFLWGRSKIKRARRIQEYISIIGNANAMELQILARTTNVPIDTVTRDITWLLHKNLFGSYAYLDASNGYLIFNEVGKSEVVQMVQDRYARVQNEKKQETSEQGKAAFDGSAKLAEDDILYQIRKVNDDIADKQLSDQIDRIEVITRQILQYLQSHPDQSGQLRTFLSYYLPTTLKILNTYADMERQAIQGKNITETRTKIEKTMAKVVTGFEAQLDQLYANDRMDIASEIHVLENMMKQDGLAADESNPFSQAL